MGFPTMTGLNMLYLSTIYQVSFLHPEFRQKETCLCICSGAGSNSPESLSASEISDSSYVKELDKEGRQSFQQYDDCISENLDPPCDSFGRASCIYDNGHTSADHLSTHSPMSRRIE